jgi:hypothetical protein
MKQIVWVCVILAVLIMIFVYLNWFYKPSKSKPVLTVNSNIEVAKNLKSKGWTMYGSDKCKFCRKQKEELGDGFSHIEYIDCETNPEKCAELGNVGIPFWKCSDGRTMNGYQTLDQLKTNM